MGTPALSGFKQLTSQAGWCPFRPPAMMVVFVWGKALWEKRSTLSSVTDVLMGGRYTQVLGLLFCCAQDDTAWAALGGVVLGAERRNLDDVEVQAVPDEDGDISSSDRPVVPPAPSPSRNGCRLVPWYERGLPANCASWMATTADSQRLSSPILPRTPPRSN